MTVRMKKITITLLSIICLIATLLAGTMITTYADDDEGTDYSFYNLSSAATKYMSKCLSPDNAQEDDSDRLSIYLMHGMNGNVQPGDAGIYVGYCDSERDGGLIGGWIMSVLSMSSVSRDYVSFKNVGSSMGSSSEYNAVYYYTQYGNLLNSIGLDQTDTSGGSLARLFGGSIMLLTYLTSISVAGIFSILLKVLKFANPFRIFTAVGAVADYTGLTANPNSFFGGLTSQAKRWYNQITSLSWAVVIPLFFVFLVLSLCLFRVQSKGSKIKKYIIRIAFVAVGVPICASLYTGTLNAIDESLATSNFASTKVIASTFVDFRAWVKDSRLNPYDGTVFNMDCTDSGPSGIVENATYTNLRNTCLTINSASGAVNGLTRDSDLNSNNLTYDTVKKRDSNITKDGMLDAMGMLVRYTNGDFYHAGDYESYAKSQSNSGIKGSDPKVKDWFDSMSDLDNWNASADEDSKTIKSGIAKKVLFNGSLQYPTQVNDDKGVNFKSNGDNDPGLSVLSMYNYLCTKFDTSSLVVYSNETSSSGFVKESHYSVNLIGGSGMSSFLYYLNSLIMLLAYTVIGWWYAFGMFIANIRRGIRSITSIPFALLGSIAAIAKVITHVAMLIIEILGTFFVYALVTELLFTMNTVLESLFTTGFNTLGLGTITLDNMGTNSPVLGGIIGGYILSQILLIAEIIFMIWFTVMAVKLRKTIVKGIDEAIGNVVDRIFTSTNPDPQKQPSAMKGAAGALGAGVAMGAGQQLGRNAMSKKAAASSSPNGTSKSANGSDGSNGTDDAGSSLIFNGDAGGTSDSMSKLTETSDATGSDASKSSDVLGKDGASGDGTGMIAGKTTDTMFSENNQEQADKSLGERVQGMTSLGGDTKEEKDDKNAVKEAKQQRNLDAAMGYTSAISDEKYAEEKREIEEQAKKDAATKGIKSATQTAVGAGEVIAGGATGNAELVKDGAKNTVNGVGGMGDARKDARNAKTDASAVAIENEQIREQTNASYGGATQGGATNVSNSTDHSVTNNSDSSKTSVSQNNIQSNSSSTKVTKSQTGVNGVNNNKALNSARRDAKNDARKDAAKRKVNARKSVAQKQQTNSNAMRSTRNNTVSGRKNTNVQYGSQSLGVQRQTQRQTQYNKTNKNGVNNSYRPAQRNGQRHDNVRVNQAVNKAPNKNTKQVQSKKLEKQSNNSDELI